VLSYKQGRVEGSTRGEFFQFRGREYAKQLVRMQGFESFKKVGSVFWYDQERKATSVTRWYDQNGEGTSLTQDGSEQDTMKALRDELTRMYYFHVDVRLGNRSLSPGTSDLYDELNRAFETIFHPRRLVRVEPKPILGSEEYWFMLDDGHRDYELDEISSGERAVFPILFDFVKWNVNRSVILIDEIELHLHPPLQQFLLESLPKLGKDNQFIVTTHSEEVLNVVPENQVHRVGT
jgi:predicted ATPase